MLKRSRGGNPCQEDQFEGLKIIHKLIYTVHIYVSRLILSPKVESMKPVVATIFKSVGLIQPGCVFIYLLLLQHYVRQQKTSSCLIKKMAYSTKGMHNLKCKIC
jgi:hypothetical protein